jgi:hypothetical protein
VAASVLGAAYLSYDRDLFTGHSGQLGIRSETAPVEPIGLAEFGVVPLRMTGLTLTETVARWKALEPSARRRLILHLVRLLAVLVVIYAVAALVFQSWWWPPVVIVVSTLLTGLVRRLSPPQRARE